MTTKDNLKDEILMAMAHHVDTTTLSILRSVLETKMYDKKIENEETTLPATGHNYKDVSKAPTCTEDGLSGKKCENCGDSDVKTENKLGHDYIETIVPPTCTEEGYTKHTCDRCGDEYIDNIVPELGHDYKVIEKTEPDCDKDGEEKQKCDNCDDIKITTIPSLGHDYKDTVVPPTTKEEGYTEHTCGNCGDSYKDTITPVLGASFLKRGIDFHVPDGTTKVVFTNIDAPEDVETEDVSMDGDNSVVAWSDGTTYMVSSQSKNNVIIANKDCDSMFLNVPTLSEIDFSNISFEQTESMEGMFAACKGLKTIDLSMIDTSNVANMKKMFSQAGIKELDLTSWDISNVKNMVSMFAYCEELEKLDISTFETENLTEAWGMFYCCYSLKDLQLKLDASKCKDISFMFCSCESLEQIDLTNFNTTGVEVMDALFANCYKLKELDVKHFDMSNVISADGMFEDCSMLEELDLSTWKTSKLENVSGMFSMCHELKTLDLTGWDVSSFDCVWQMFNNCENLETIYADDWSEKVSPCDKHAGRNERVFDSCDKLVGAVSFEETKTKNWSMANTQTGYFTLKPIE